MTIIIIIAAVILSAARVVRMGQQLADMEENIENAMSQIGVQLSSLFDILSALAKLTEEHAADGSQSLTEAIDSKRRTITKSSDPSDVTGQERAASALLDRIAVIAESCTGLKSDDRYSGYLKAAESCERMISTSCLIYNDSVSRLNRTIRRFPVSAAAKLLGVSHRKHIETC